MRDEIKRKDERGIGNSIPAQIAECFKIYYGKQFNSIKFGCSELIQNIRVH